MADKEKKNRPITLPYFNHVVRQFDETFHHRIHEQARADGVLSRISSYIIHEGDSSKIIRNSDEAEATEMHEASATLDMKKSDVEHFTVTDAYEAIGKLAEQFRQHHSQTLFSTIDRVTQKTGNVVSGKGQPLSHEMLFEILGRIEQDFSSNSNQGDLVMVVAPEMMGRIEELREQFSTSPELQEKYKALMAKKYEQFRDREMDRTLAG
ncbi:hypothetical protein VB618_09280 [Microvirga sp. CF3062]|uniref:hypothetical protein n=1 Tax=Microvirga sp. CF3062 TaxID=3110182 RepID=UPI002E7A8FD4|nr:hypothetical protein [Microvirga sp. CF3062]MEE1656388.1 hypothetical protein [Microvirga sp. CF3062]